MTDLSLVIAQAVVCLALGGLFADRRLRRNLRRTRAELDDAKDRIDGLESDLRMAVQTAYNRGAYEWACLNYPGWIAWLEQSARADRRQ